MRFEKEKKKEDKKKKKIGVPFDSISRGRRLFLPWLLPKDFCLGGAFRSGLVCSVFSLVSKNIVGWFPLGFARLTELLSSHRVLVFSTG
jgi:hypothetical protein